MYVWTHTQMQQKDAEVRIFLFGRIALPLLLLLIPVLLGAAGHKRAADTVLAIYACIALLNLPFQIKRDAAFMGLDTFKFLATGTLVILSLSTLICASVRIGTWIDSRGAIFASV